MPYYGRRALRVLPISPSGHRRRREARIGVQAQAHGGRAYCECGCACLSAPPLAQVLDCSNAGRVIDALSTMMPTTRDPAETDGAGARPMDSGPVLGAPPPPPPPARPFAAQASRSRKQGLMEWSLVPLAPPPTTALLWLWCIAERTCTTPRPPLIPNLPSTPLPNHSQRYLPPPPTRTPTPPPPTLRRPCHFSLQARMSLFWALVAPTPSCQRIRTHPLTSLLAVSPRRCGWRCGSLPATVRMRPIALPEAPVGVRMAREHGGMGPRPGAHRNLADVMLCRVCVPHLTRASQRYCTCPTRYLSRRCRAPSRTAGPRWGSSIGCSRPSPIPLLGTCSRGRSSDGPLGSCANTLTHAARRAPLLRSGLSLCDDTPHRLFRQDLLLASLFRNFLVAQRVMARAGLYPVSAPSLPPMHLHPLWVRCA